VGLADGQHYLVMDYVPGQTLAHLTRNGPLPIQRAAQYLRTVASAVHFAHERGILHRDLKPSNVLIDANDQPRVTDFGLAKRFGSASSLSPEHSTLTLSGQVLGSPAFIPPEQASGQRGRIGRRSDVYALGAILYQLLTGRPPFGGEALADTLRQVLDEEPLGLRRLNPTVPLELETICLKCLEKEPDRRYPTAQALAEELGRFLEQRPILAQPIGVTQRVWRWCRRKPALASLGAGVIILLLAVAIGSPIALYHIDRARSEAVEQALLARRNAYAADMNLVQLACEESDLDRAREMLNRHRPTGESGIRNLKSESDLRSWEWRYLWARCQSEERFTLHKYPNPVWALAFSPDGKWLAVRRNGGAVALWDAGAKRVVPPELPGGGQYPTYKALAFSPQGNLLAWGRKDASGTPGVSLWDLTVQQEIAHLPYSKPFVSVAFSPDAKEVATLVNDGKVLVWDVVSRQVKTNIVTRPIAKPPAQHYAAAIMPTTPAGDGNVLSSPSRGPTFSDHYGCVLFSPDGQWLAIGGGRTANPVVEPGYRKGGGFSQSARDRRWHHGAGFLARQPVAGCRRRVRTQRRACVGVGDGRGTAVCRAPWMDRWPGLLARWPNAGVGQHGSNPPPLGCRRER
jgi:hypothetical protein